MLRFDLSEIVRTVGMHQVYRLDEQPYTDEDVEFVSPIRGQVSVTNGSSVILVRGHVDTAIDLECVRCLGPVRYPLHTDIEEQFSLSEVEDSTYRDSSPEIIQDDEHEIPEGLFSGKVMDFRVLLRQAAILDSPLSPLCKEDCAGLCLTCGKNLNEGSCRCAPRAAKPFSALADLLKDHDED